jgi:hypothetical protein
VIYALRLGLNELEAWYVDACMLSEPAVDGAHPRFFPSPSSYVAGGRSVPFEYERALAEDARCTAFRARATGGVSVVVKFVAGYYGRDAHELLAREDLAPVLVYCGPLYITTKVASTYKDVLMVVTQYLAGYKTLREAPERLGAASADSLERVLALLAEHGFVHGDLLEDNILVSPQGDVKITDFNWAGFEGAMRYPHDLSPTGGYPKGAEPLGLITAEHDRAAMDIAARGRPRRPGSSVSFVRLAVAARNGHSRKKYANHFIAI